MARYMLPKRRDATESIWRQSKPRARAVIHLGGALVDHPAGSHTTVCCPRSRTTQDAGVTSVEKGAAKFLIGSFIGPESASKSNVAISTLRTLGLSLVWK